MKYNSNTEEQETKRNIATLISRISPLYEYWNSDQEGADESNRVAKSNVIGASSNLFKEEPYKWEILYQSIFRELIKGDFNSLKGLKILISMLNKSEEFKILKRIKDEGLLEESMIKSLEGEELSKSQTKTNLLRFSRILFAIFTNPYEVDMKGEKKHLYEKTGFIINKIRKMLTF